LLEAEMGIKDKETPSFAIGFGGQGRLESRHLL
jgi:hypothetical protein